MFETGDQVKIARITYTKADDSSMDKYLGLAGVVTAVRGMVTVRFENGEETVFYDFELRLIRP